MTIDAPSAPLKVAVLINSTNAAAMKTAFLTGIGSGHEVDFYDPIDTQSYPDPNEYDLIVLSGGKAPPTSDIPWIAKEKQFIRNTVQQFPHKKILGICWGHQVTALTFGGTVEEMGWAEIGVTRIPLTEAGTRFFGSSIDELRLNEWHKRAVTAPGKGFIPLAEGNQAYVNSANTVLTLQGHPEMNAEWAETLYANAADYVKLAPSERSAEEVKSSIYKPQDGPLVWRRILRWVREP